MRLITILAMLLAMTSTASGETLLVDSLKDAASVTTPARGSTMESVASDFGEPQLREGPVGEPPISQWDYGNYIVYFEYDRVIHSVVKPN
jgi:hypothetical protein